MKRKKLLKYLSGNGCKLQWEGARHSRWINPKLNKRSSITRHTEISDILAKKICKDLSVTPLD
jgi:mRNA interferase HicA